MEKRYSKILKMFALVGILPFIYGCGSGGGTGALLGFLFGGAGVGGGTLALLSGSVADAALTGGAATQLATLHQPEPASMLLIGGGLAVMTYFKSKSKLGNK